MFHSIISDYDVFFAGNEEYAQSQCLDVICPSANINNKTPHQSFFSTNPDDYLRIMGSENNSVY